MNTKVLLAIALASVSLAGCNRDAPQAVDAVDAAPPADSVAAKPVAPDLTGPRAPAGSQQVEAPVAEGASTPLRMSSGQEISTAFIPDRSGTLLALGVRIGNSRGTSDGALTLNLCRDAACQDIVVPLSGTRDNGYLIFNLTTPVEVVGGQAYDFKLFRSADATKSVAIWTHPAPVGARTVIGTDNVDTGRVARLVFYFKK